MRLFSSRSQLTTKCGKNKKWRSEPGGLNVTISASCDWSVAIFPTSLESQESYLTLRNLTLQITRDFFRRQSTFARLYNAAASPASGLRSAGSLAIVLESKYCAVNEITQAAKFVLNYYYMANPVLGKFLCSDWFFSDTKG